MTLSINKANICLVLRECNKGFSEKMNFEKKSENRKVTFPKQYRVREKE